MKSLFQLIPAIMLSFGLLPSSPAIADSHGHIIHRDHDGNCSSSEDEDSDDDDCDFESSDDSEHHHAWVHDQKEIEPGFEDEDLTQEVDRDTAWPSKRENFSEMFR